MQRPPPLPSLLVAVCLLAGCHEEIKAPPPPPPDVKAAEVLVRDVPEYVEVIGETRGNTEIEIRARIEGFIETVDYKEGAFVEKGALLYTIDSRPFEAQLAVDKASLAEAEAQLARTHQDVARYEPLVAKNAISRQDYETAVALEKAAAAVVEAGKAVVKQGEINLSYTRVVAPDSGLAGRTEVYAGTLVGRGQSTLLTRISRIDPIHVRFSVPEKDYLTMARKRGSGTSPQGDAKTTFELFMADGSLLESQGELVFLDRNVDKDTGTIMVEASFANAGQIVRPGQYARVRATVDQKKGAVLVPQRAVFEQQGVYSVMVLVGDKVEQRLVTPGERRGSLWVISSGLKKGEHVVVEGLQKVRPGMQVTAQTVLIEEKPKSETPVAGAPADGAAK